ncbi:hypothetical protein AKJ57_03870 [candidate division MSBL1 archaeon SCGC-AAA259A05]|uniref:Amidohydrolase-related domain-containing protein n=1 Tax=candidate division MSBL1 archaeon SCGC-AAA259A05 TaxID=1698259 RepID=A0A133U989_9EURY|nr:hypothetical protein AKJ57_03870 [candidate division MSBL1 archaeon SCGC-AAA259A05]
MTVADCHVHLHETDDPGKTSERLLEAMDSNNVSKVCLFAPPPYPDDELSLQDSQPNPEAQRESTDLVAEVASADPDRIVPFAWISPLLDESIGEVERGVREHGIEGVKMDPNHWYPYDEEIFPLYEKVEELRLPIIFHSGINFAFVDASRFSRPAYFEPLIRFPDLKFALAHVSWPWVVECLATAGHFKFAEEECGREKMQMYVDITPGTPPSYRAEALDKAVKYLGDNFLLFGSDASTENLEHMRRVIRRDKIVYEQLGWSRERKNKVFEENLRKFLKHEEGSNEV